MASLPPRREKNVLNRLFMTPDKEPEPLFSSPEFTARDKEKAHLSLVIALRNEAENIPTLLKEVDKALKGYSHEIILVDDGSDDETVQVINAINHPRVNLIELTRNFGQCPALKAGIDYATGDYIVTMDGDLQNNPKEIPAMLALSKLGNLDVVVGIRRRRKDAFLLRLLPSRIANWLIQRLTGANIRDNGCGLKLFRAKTAKALPLYGELHRFIAVLAYFDGARISQMEVTHRARVAGRSKYGIGRTFRVISDLILLLFFRKFRQRPMHFFGTTGLLTSLTGGAILLYFLVIKLMGADIWGRPLLVLGALLLIMGFQIITIGMILDFQMRTYFETQKKSPYAIRKIHKPH